MRLLYVCADRGIPLAGDKGASVHVRSITSAIQRLGHQVTLLAANTSGDNPWPEVSGIEKLALDPVQAETQIADVIDDMRAHLLIERYSLQSGPARAASTSTGVPQMLEVNAPLADEATRYRGLDDPLAGDRERSVLRAADRIQVVSPALLRYVREVAPDVPALRVANGVDLDRFASAAPAEIPSIGTGPVVGFVGSMKRWHGVADLLDAFAAVRRHVPTAQLLLVGGGPEEPDLRRRAESPDLAGSVVFTGAVNHGEVPGYLKRLDLAVAPYLPQKDFYFQPLKIVEYLAAGVPVVYCDQGGLADLVGPGGVGFEPGSVPEMADRIREVLADRAGLAEMARQAAARAGGSSWDQVAEAVVSWAAGPCRQTANGQ